MADTSHDLNRKMYAMGKAITAAIITAFYMGLSILALVLLGYAGGFITIMFRLAPTLIASLFVLGITAILATAIIFAAMALQIDLRRPWHGAKTYACTYIYSNLSAFGDCNYFNTAIHNMELLYTNINLHNYRASNRQLSNMF